MAPLRDREVRRLEALLELQQGQFVDERGLVQAGLEHAVAISDSEIGYFHEFDEQASVIRLTAWSQAVHAQCSAPFATHYPLESAGVWADCVRTRAPVIHNEYTASASPSGLPEGHFPVRRHMSVPVFDGERIVAILGVGNAEAPYTELDALQVAAFASGLWNVLLRQRTQVRLRQMAELTTEGIILVDGFRIAEVNTAAERLLGADAEQLVAGDVRDLLRRSGSSEPYAPVFGGDEAIELDVLDPEGRRRPVELQARPIAGSTRMVLNLRDLTPHRKVQGRLRLLGTAADAAAEALMITDAAGNIQYVNAAFERVSGYTQSEVLGRNPRLLKSRRNSPELYADLWATIRRGDVWTGRLTNRHKDGSLFYEDAIISPVRGEDGEIEAYVALKRDVTREVQLEDELRQASKLEAVGQLAGGVSHDFNNLLTVILGSVELMQLDEAKPSPELDDILDAAMQAKEITTQLLAFSRLRADGDRRPLDINRFLTRSAKLYRRLIEEHVAIEYVFGDNLPPVLGDSTSLGQVLMNLVVNARDAMPSGGALTVSTSLDNREAEPALDLPAGRYVRLDLADTGEGMNEETMARIFEPFFTTKEAGKGTGLGLSTCYGIVRQHGGTIGVTSRLSVGTTFSIWLPAAGGSVATDDIRNEASLPQGEGRVLVVEDNGALRRLMARALRRAGFEVVEATDGQDGLGRLADGRSIQAVVTDVMMPQMDGRRMVSQLRQTHADLPVVFISGYAASLSAEDLERLDADLLHKPFGMSELVTALVSAMTTT